MMALAVAWFALGVYSGFLIGSAEPSEWRREWRR